MMFRQSQPNNKHKQINESEIEQKIAGMLSLIISFQTKIENSKIKLCGFSNFSPQLYFSYIDRGSKGFIDTQDITFFIKRFKNSFNVDERYLKIMFCKFNNEPPETSQDKTHLSYFGYLNLIKPYFCPQAASKLLTRDTVSAPPKYNEQILEIFHQLICCSYVTTAEHQQLKQMIAEQHLMNIGQCMNIVMKNSRNRNTFKTIGSQISIKARPYNFMSEQIIGANQKRLPSQNKIQSQNIFDKKRHVSGEYLPYFWDLIHKNQYQINEQEIKYLLAYLQCHQYMLGTQRYLSILFMPYSTNFTTMNNIQTTQLVTRPTIAHDFITQKNTTTNKRGYNFLNYVHPNSIKIKQQNFNKPQQSIRINPQHSIAPLQRQKDIKINDIAQSSINTPFLQKFLRESNINKNMSIRRSKYQNENNNQSNSSQDNSAFIQDSGYLEPKYNDYKKQYSSIRNPSDFNFKKIQQSESMHQSEFIRHFQKPKINNLMPIQQDNEGNGSVLGQFMIR